MFASRKVRMLALVGMFAVLVFAATAATAEAGNGHRILHNQLHFAHQAHFAHQVYFTPVVKYVVQPYTYPVVLVNCYGQPYTVWQTVYRTVPVRVFP